MLLLITGTQHIIILLVEVFPFQFQLSSTVQ
jgi:hypothetical protein